MTARPWTPESRDALLTRVTALTAGTAVAGAVGAVGLGAAFAVTTHPKSVSRTTTGTSAAAPATSGVASTTTKARTVSPSQVRVQVLNGLGVAGAARAVADQLTASGFDVVGIGNAPGGAVSASVIVYPPAETEAVRLLAVATGVSAVSPSGTGSVLTLVIGPDWTGTLPAQSNVSQNNVAAPVAPAQNGGGGGGMVVSGGS